MAYQTSTNLYENTKYIVDATGATPYTTIQAAINAANTAGILATVYIRPGAYTEDLTLYDKITLEGAGYEETTITGTHTPPVAGTIVFQNLKLTDATAILSSAAAGTTGINFRHCNFVVTNGFVCNLANWTGIMLFDNCLDASTNNGVVSNSANAEVVFLYSVVGSGSGNSLTINGLVECTDSIVRCPIALTGGATSGFIGTTFLDEVSVGGTAEVSFEYCVLKAQLTCTTTSPVTLSHITVDTVTSPAIDGTSTVVFIGVNFVENSTIAATIVQTLTKITKTGEIHAENVQNMDMTGFMSWAAGGPYFDDTTLGTFQLLVGGTGYIHSKLVTWVAQNIAGLTSGSTWFIYIDSTGTIGKASTRTDALFEDNIVLFECLYDETLVTKQQHTVKENHPYHHQAAVSNYEHDVIGSVINNSAQGANITLVGPANVKIAISGADILEDHGLETTIPDSGGAGVVFKRFYTNAAGKWAVQNTSDTFAGFYNNAGTPTALPANKYGVYRLYVSKDNLNSATPTYYAVLDTTFYNNAAAANTAISNNTPAASTNELAGLEMAQLGFIVWEQAIAQISTVFIAKSTLRGTISTGTTNVAALVTTNTASFNGILSAADTNVQAALDTIDNWGAGTTDHAVIIGNGAGSALGALAVGATGEVLIGNTGADPSWSATPTVTTVFSTTFDTNVAAAAVTLTGTTLSADGTDANIDINITAKGTGTVIIDELTLTTDLAVTEGGTGASTLTDNGVLYGNGVAAIGATAEGATGVILTGVVGNPPTWTTATYPSTVNKGDVLIASADDVVDIVAGATTAGYVLTANGAATAPSFQTPSGLLWAVEAADMAAVANRGYIANKAGTLTFTLPVTCAVGKTFRFTGINTALGWKIAQNNGQTIYFGASATTTGAAGYLQSTAIRDAVEIVCVVADTDFNVVSSIGNITVA